MATVTSHQDKKVTQVGLCQYYHRPALPLPVKMSTRQGAVKQYCFTLNNYTPEDEEKVKKFITEQCTWGFFGKEKGEKGTPHLQGAFVLKKSSRITALKKSFHPTAHIEQMKGHPDQSREYCGKEDQNPFEFGTCPSRGGATKQKANWDEVRSLAKQARYDDIPSDIYIRYRSTLHAIGTAARCPPSFASVTGLWLYGPSGTGKSSFARSFDSLYVKNLNKWWCGYQDEKIVLIEDIDPDSGKHLGQFLKVWTDHYAFRAESKGSSSMIRPALLIITSNYAIDQVFPAESMSQPLIRRCPTVYFDVSGHAPRSADLISATWDAITSDYIKETLSPLFISSLLPLVEQCSIVPSSDQDDSSADQSSEPSVVELPLSEEPSADLAESFAAAIEDASRPDPTSSPL